MGLREIFDALARGIGDAVTDIRHKVVEEGWFGREVTPMHGAPEPTMAETLGWTTHTERGKAGLSEPVDHHEQGPDREKGLDR